MTVLYRAIKDDEWIASAEQNEILNFMSLGVDGEWVSVETIIEGLREMNMFAEKHCENSEDCRKFVEARIRAIQNIDKMLEWLIEFGFIESKIQ